MKMHPGPSWRHRLEWRATLVVSLGLAGAWVAACAETVGSPVTTPATPPFGLTKANIPPDLREKIARVEKLGELLYRFHHMEEIATTFLATQVAEAEKHELSESFTTVESTSSSGPPSFVSQFFTKEDQPRIAFRVHMFPQREPILEKLSPPLVVDASVLSQLRARETALARVPKWNPPLKAIVVPGAMVGEQAGIVVYVVRLGATKDDLALGMHYRALLSSDGTTLQNIEPLSDVSDVTHVNGSEGGLPGMSNFRLGHPSEADVLTSLRHPNLEFMVVSEHVRWMVFHGSIGAQKEPPEPALVDALKDALRTIANRNHMPLDALPADPR